MRLAQMCLDVVDSLYPFKHISPVNVGTGLKAHCTAGDEFDGGAVIDRVQLHIC